MHLKALKKCNPYLHILLALGIAAATFRAISILGPQVGSGIDHQSNTVLFIVSLLFVLSFLVFYISTNTSLPPFVIAIFFGMAAHDILQPLLVHPTAVNIVVGLGATLILFGGGLETPFRNFKRLAAGIFSLAFVGVLVTAILLSGTLVFISNMLGANIPVAVSVLLGAVLASTDPAAIIPTLKRLRFKHTELKDIIISESALTDVSGALLTITFIALIGLQGMEAISITSAYNALFSFETLLFLSKEAFIGLALGLVGYALLHLFVSFKRRHTREFEADAAIFLCIPIFVYAAAHALGGSGFLAAFVAGLLFHVTEHLRETERFFNHVIDGFFKLTIFILLGALIDINQLVSYTAVGLIGGLIFIFIIRPFVVFLSLGPFLWFKSYPFTVQDLLFMSWVRETGAIPAVLLVSIAAMGFPGAESLLPIGAWIILLTLTVQPALTPWVAKKLHVAECIKDDSRVVLSSTGEQVVVLATRGNSYLRRLPKVAEWAAIHGVKKVVVLLCLEDAYSEEKVIEKETASLAKFEEINQLRVQKQEEPLEFSLLARRGFLQKNLSTLAKEETNISAFFVGKRMLDYKLDEIKSMAVPFYFME